METSIFIPKKIHVGFQTRHDTYTKKLAYIIYEDEKGVLRKQKSWNGWRDKSLGEQIEDNVPTSGFVLNKKVGDYVSYWSHRQAYIRVYDPRGFEFEITVQNLLYILENASSIKGKGLEGEFVYGWNGTELVLLPVESPDYKEILAYNEARFRKETIKAKDLIIGATYKNKDNESLVYLGRFEYWTKDYIGVKRVWTNKDKKGKVDKRHIFYKLGDYYYHFTNYKSIPNSIIALVNEHCHENYAQFYEEMEHKSFFSPVNEGVFVYEPYTLEEWNKAFSYRNRWSSVIFFTSDNECYYVHHLQNGNIGVTNKRDGVKYIDDMVKLNQVNGTLYDSLEEVYNAYQPQHKYRVLVNGKKHEEVTYDYDL